MDVVRAPAGVGQVRAAAAGLRRELARRGVAEGGGIAEDAYEVSDQDAGNNASGAKLAGAKHAADADQTQFLVAAAGLLTWKLSLAASFNLFSLIVISSFSFFLAPPSVP